MKLSIVISFLILVPICSLLAPDVRSSMENKKNIIDDLYDGISGFGINSDEERNIRDKGSSPVYGEITPEGVSLLLKYLALTKDDVFYDLGSGVGKMVTQVYLQTPVKKSVGIELSPTRSKKAYSVKEKCVKKNLVDSQRLLEFCEGDIMSADFSDATVIYLASTCFNDEYMKKITDRLAQLKKGLRLMTLRKLPLHKDFKEITQLTVPMTWSTGSTVYLYMLEPQANANPIKMVSRK